MGTIHEILSEITAKSLSLRDKGSMFERLMQRWLNTDPRYAGKFTDVWLWYEFPYRDQFGYKDLGIDLVAKTEMGEYWAIQCKCYGEDKEIEKSDVDTFISTSGKTFSDGINSRIKFSQRLWISTTNVWSDHAEETIQNQDPPVIRISLRDLEISTVDWDKLLHGEKGKEALRKGKQPMRHQLEAIAKAEEYYKDHDRGKLIMACGTGKTFTSLKIVEKIVGRGKRGLVLFLVPSIALLGQSFNDWSSDAAKPIKAICICSDPLAAKRRKRGQEADDMDWSLIDVPLPASTDVETITKRLDNYRDYEGLVVVFSTYQSVDVISEAQKRILQDTHGEYGVFDFIVCDEAHRTTGVKLTDADESNFTKIHKNENVQGKRRMYMTATPRLYGENAKVKASKQNLILCSMDDKAIYGEEFYRVNFSYAVQNGILTDYKVLVLTVSDDMIPENILEKVRDEEVKELKYDNAARMVGVINALSKKLKGDDGVTWKTDPRWMRRALAFTYKIGDPSSPGTSKNIAATFPKLSEWYDNGLSEEEKKEVVHVKVKHVDGSMGAMRRADALQWLAGDAEDPQDPQECRVITNVRCLSEGVDVPALDAVLFLSARNSPVDVVQSVGRVMRAFHKGQPDEKKYGYIIIPIVVPEGTKPEDALDNNEVYSVLWDIVNALRSHDDNFNAHINTIALNKNRSSSKVVVAKGGFNPGGGIGTTSSGDEAKDDIRQYSNAEVARQLEMRFGDSQQAIYAKLVEKCGDRSYWENWAKEVGEIAKNYMARITKLVKEDGGKYNEYFARFVKTLQHDLNPGVTEEQCVEMLAQHMITRPVFEALFKDYKFVGNNSVSRSMQFMVELLRSEAMDKDLEVMGRFYKSVRLNVADIDNLKGKQTTIKTLYEKFFKGAFPKTVEKMGTVYTPVECVDFIIHSVDDILKEKFGTALTNENVHILDPFVGTGTFITRLLQTDVIDKKDLVRKYQREIHCNEIILLAYYVADINIEAVFQELCPQDQYLPFNGICLTDTFQLGEQGNGDVFDKFFRENTESVEEQRKTPVRVIIGNPPYSAGQKDANDNAQNQHYQKLENRIAETYAAHTNSTNKNSIYNSYIKAYRWATDRLDSEEGGVIGFISDGAWLDGSAQEGIRACFQKEFDKIYVFNLRGNARTSSELRRKEGGGIFAGGSRTPIAITLLVRYPKRSHGAKCEIYYHDIGDYLKREAKLKIIDDFKSYKNIPWDAITPNRKHDWIKQRGDLFDTFIVIGDKKEKNNKQTFFEPVYSCGLKTNRDAWCYNSDKEMLADNIKGSIDYYNSEVGRIAELVRLNPSKEAKEFIDYDAKPQKFTWDRTQKDSDLPQRKKYAFDTSSIMTAFYRPFFKQYCYFNRQLNNCVYQLPQLFPTPRHKNLVICVSGVGVKKEFSCIMSDILPDFEVIGKSQCFPLYYYEKDKGQPLFSIEGGGWTRHSGITDWILKEVKERFHNPRDLTKEDIFYYVYGILHSPEYRTRFANDLEKSLPRLPIVDGITDFMAFSKAGRELAELHLNYDKDLDGMEERVREKYGVSVERAKSEPMGEDRYEYYKVTKMRFPRKDDKSRIIYNGKLSINGIPEGIYRYIVNGKSAIEWLLERYRVTKDKDTLIVNDPNKWCREQENPRYILDTLLSVIDVSMETMRIVDALPKLDFQESL